METRTLENLIDKQDGFQIVGDLIASILVNEVANQKNLASEANKNPDDWNFKVYRERSIPEGSFEDNPKAPPLVNIWYDNSNFPKSKGNVVECQRNDATYNLDIYAPGTATNNPGKGHFTADLQAALNLQNIIKLVRNILMAAINIHLQRQGVIGNRWINSITAFTPQFNNNNTLHVQAARIIFNVEFNEFSPQIAGDILEQVNIDLKRASDGEIVSEIEINY